MLVSNLTVQNIPTSENNTKLYNGQKYQIDIIFDNLQGNKFQLNLASMVSLDIEEDSRTWYKRASLVIKNPDNVFEQKIVSTALPTQYYKFRNDGRDVVYITVKIVNDSTLGQVDANVDYNVWGMSYAFAIYDREEIPGDNTKLKQLKLYLWEFEQQVLSETTLQWSTNNLLPSNVIPASASDTQKYVKTGNAIKNLLTTALANYVTPVFTSTWDIGSSNTFYSSPSNWTADDNLNYLLKKHVSAPVGTDGGQDPCILTRNRYDNNWKLISYTTLFNQAVNSSSNGIGISIPTAGSLQREIITLSMQGGVDQNEYLFNLPQSPFNSNTSNTNFNSPITSVIKNINFVDMSPIDSSRDMISTPCYSNDIKNKLFNVDFASNDIQNVKTFVKNNYANKLKLYSAPDTLITLNKTKTDTLAVNHVYSYSPDKVSQLAEGRNFLLASALYYNTSVSFTTLGVPIREANTFISIEKGQGGVIDEFFNKLLGQWLICNVVHRFTQGNYINDVTALRVHANDNIDIKSNIT